MTDDRVLQDVRSRQISVHAPTLLRGLFVQLPEPGCVFTKSQREAWLALASAVFDSLYEEGGA